MRSLRRGSDLTQQKVAEHLGLSRDAAYQKYESGVVVPPPDKLVKLAALFNVTVDYLLRPPGPEGGPQSAVESGPMANALRIECKEVFHGILDRAGTDLGELDRLLGKLRRLEKEL